jgi:polyphosphate glucokinase
MSSLPRTLAVDVGGTGIKAAVLDSTGNMHGERVRIATTYPMPPSKLVEVIGELAAKLPAFNRVSIGFPGVVREGHVLTAPHFVTESGPGTKVVPALSKQWAGFDLAGQVGTALSAPVRLANDADLQGADVVSGKGLELVVTLGTGLGTGVFYNGHLSPHLELAHHPFMKGLTYNEAIGEAARRKIGNRRWNKRVSKAITTLHDLFLYDHLYIGGGNSSRVTAKLGADTTIVDNQAGLLGGIKLWETDELGSRRPAGTTASPPTSAKTAPARGLATRKGAGRPAPARAVTKRRP